MGRRITEVLSVLFVFVLPWRQATELPGGLSIGPPIAVVLAIAWVGTVVSGRTVRKPHPFHLALGLYAGYIALSIAWSVDPAATIARLVRTLYILALLVIYWDLLRDSDRFETAVQALVLGAFVIALSGIWTFVTGDLGGRRTVAHGVNANALARWVTLAAPFAAYLAVVSRRYGRGPWRYLNFGYLLITPLAVGATVSRQGFVVLLALTGVAILGAIYRWKDVRGLTLVKGVLGTIVAGAVLLAFGLLTPTAVIIDRLSSFPTALSTFGNRTPIWMAGIDSFRANPVVGIGAGAYGEVLEPGGSVDPHNMVLGVGVELGLLGLLVFLVAVLSPLGVAVRSTRVPLLAVAIYLSLGLYAIVAMLYTDPFNWLMILFVLIRYSFDDARSVTLGRTESPPSAG